MDDLFEPQIEQRGRLDTELLDQSYTNLARSVGDDRSRGGFKMSDLSSRDGAVLTCLRTLGVRPPSVPDNIKDPAARIEWLCRPSGTMYRTVRLAGAWYKDSIGTLLGQLDSGEYIALLPGTFGGRYYHDQRTGRKVRVTKKVARHIKPEATCFYRPLPSRALSLSVLLQFTLNSLDVNDYVCVIAAALAATLVGLQLPWVNSLIFSTVVPSGETGLIVPIAALLVGLILSMTLFDVCRNLIVARVTSKLRASAEAAVFSRMLLLPTSFFKKQRSGSLADRISQVTMLMELITSLVFGSFLTVLFSLVYVVQISFYAPALVLPALVIIVLQAILTVSVAKVAVRWQTEAMDAQAGVSGMVTALLAGIQKIKIAGAENRAFARWAEEFKRYTHAEYNTPVIVRALPTLVSFVGMLGMIVIYLNAAQHDMSVADYIAFGVAYGQAAAALLALANLSPQVARVRPMFRLIEPILAAEPEIDENKPSVNRLHGTIEVSGVSFRYDEDLPYVLKGLSFRIEPGEYVAIVGESGAGKSTIVRLLLGFETPQVGSIVYDNNDVSEVNLRSLRQAIGSVTQDGSVFAGDILSNILLGCPEGTIDDAWKAAEIAGIADDIRRMPMGMHTVLSEGTGSISGGQRQRLMIARAVCGDKRVMLFDEATSALDNITQKQVSDALGELNCTRLVVAHRLSTVKNCDRILMLEGGRVIEEGSYDELIELDGAFADLVRRQRCD